MQTKKVMKNLLFIFLLSLYSSGGTQVEVCKGETNPYQKTTYCQKCRQITLLNGGVIYADSVTFDDPKRLVIIHTGFIESKNIKIQARQIFSILPTNRDSKLIINTIN